MIPACMRVHMHYMVYSMFVHMYVCVLYVCTVHTVSLNIIECDSTVYVGMMWKKMAAPYNAYITVSQKILPIKLTTYIHALQYT